MAVRKTKVGAVFGAILRQERSKQGLSQERLAELAGCSAVWVSNVETGRYQPTLKRILAFESALKLPGGDLVHRTSMSLGSVPRKRR